jgi:hypothetical protein
VITAAAADTLVLRAVGIALVLLATGDMFLTIFNYDGYTTLTRLFHHGLWTVIRFTTRPLPERPRHFALSIGSALLLPASVAAWLGAEITGFALAYDGGLRSGAFALRGASPSFGTAFYLSAGDISSLTFGDVVARGGFERACVDLETIVGLATFTLALGYVVTAFGALACLESLHGRVRRHAEDVERPESIVRRHFLGGHPADLPAFLQALGDDLEAYDRGLRRYSVVYYFHTRRTRRSIPHVFTALGDLIALLRFGLPGEGRMTQNPFVAALHDGYRQTLDRLRRSFVGPDPIAEPEPLDSHAFATAWRQPGEDAAVDAFRRLTSLSRQVAESAPGDEDGDEETYRRYRAWLPFAHTQQVVLRRVADRLGYEPPTPIAPLPQE